MTHTSRGADALASMRTAAGALLTFVASSLLGPPVGELVERALPPGLAALAGYAAARALLPLARKLQSEEAPRKERCPPRRTSSTP